MTKILVSFAALTIMGAAALPLQASAAEQRQGVSNGQSTELSAQRRYYRGPYYGYRYYGPRRYYGPLYGYYGYGVYPYGYGYPYGYYRPGIGVGIGPFGFRVF